jgi:alpha-glucosidase (family GH31 glycosyl hydrolase)
MAGENPRTMHNRYPELWAELNREFAEEWEAKAKKSKAEAQCKLLKEEDVRQENNHTSEDGARMLEEEEDDDEKLVFFTRGGYRSSPRWSTLFWEGDQMVSWQRNDGIKSAVTGLLTGGLCGFSLNHSDIGGYCTMDIPLLRYRRSEELLLRWMELNSFSTIFRTHEVRERV